MILNIKLAVLEVQQRFENYNNWLDDKMCSGFIQDDSWNKKDKNW